MEGKSLGNLSFTHAEVHMTLRQFLSWASALVFSLLLLACSSSSSIPMPESYGLYAAADGKLLGVDVPVSTMTPPMISVRLLNADQVLGPPSVDVQRIPVLPATVRFVEYGGHGIDLGKLYASPYIRHSRYSPQEVWSFHGIVSMARVQPTIQLLEGPMAGHKDVTILSPPKPLAPGVYFVYTVPEGKYWVFAVGQPAAAARSHCFDWLTNLTPCQGALSPSGASGASSSPAGSQQAIQNDQKSAVGTVRTINTAQVVYASTYLAGYSRTITQLGPPPSGVNPTRDRTGLVDGQTASGVKNGYRFIYKSGPLVGGRIDTYTLVARPLQYGVTGINSYYTDQSGVIRGTRENREPTDNDPPIAG